MAHIEELKSQVEQAEIKLQRLQEERVAILDTFADHNRVFSPFRNLPEDILREICVACVQGDSIPTLAYRTTSLPYKLGQICSGMRHIALTTPLIWAYVEIDIMATNVYHPEYTVAQPIPSLLSGLSNGSGERVDSLSR